MDLGIFGLRPRLVRRTTTEKAPVPGHATVVIPLRFEIRGGAGRFVTNALGRACSFLEDLREGRDLESFRAVLKMRRLVILKAPRSKIDQLGGRPARIESESCGIDSVVPDLLEFNAGGVVDLRNALGAETIVEALQKELGMATFRGSVLGLLVLLGGADADRLRGRRQGGRDTPRLRAGG